MPLDTLKFEHICTLCRTFVHSSSKHCGFCGRCVNQFDHHCKWLNNCIGASNYSLFLGLISSLVLSQGVYASFVIAFLQSSTREEFVGRCRDYTGWQAENFIIGIVSCSGILAVAICICVFLLLLFHCYLRLVKHLTTYEYVIMKRGKAVVYKQPEGDQGDLSDLSRHALLVDAPSTRLSGRVLPAVPLPSPTPPEPSPSPSKPQ